MILGASRYYIRQILAAQELGCEIIVTDKSPNAEGFRYADHYEVMDISDIEGSLSVARKYAIDGIIAVNDFGVKTAAVTAEEMGLVGINPNVAEYTTSKACMRQIWKDAGVPSARFRSAVTLEQAHESVEALNSWPLILKPADSRGGGSRGVSRIDCIEELEEAFKFAQDFYDDKNVIIEEYLEGSEHSIETLTFEGKIHVLAVSDKIKTPPPYRVDKSVIYPSLHRGDDLERIRQVAKEAVRAVGIQSGPAHVELCVTEDGPKLFEIGARCGGGGTPDPIVPFVTGIELFKEVVRIALGEEPQNISPEWSGKGCVYRFLTPQPGTVKEIDGLEEVKRWNNILDCDVLIKAGDRVKAVRIGADRAGFIIAGGNNRAEAITLADKAEKKIRFLYEN